MNIVMTVAISGGLFVVFAYVHFFVDFVLQTHAEAMAKHNNAKVRARHCLIYTLGFVPILWALHFHWWEWLIALNILFWSHFYLDTYHLVFLWAKYIRKPPEMLAPLKTPELDGYVKVSIPDPHQGFIAFVQTALGKILMISIDQISHLLFLWILVYLAIQHL